MIYVPLKEKRTKKENIKLFSFVKKEKVLDFWSLYRKENLFAQFSYYLFTLFFVLVVCGRLLTIGSNFYFLDDYWKDKFFSMIVKNLSF